MNTLTTELLQTLATAAVYGELDSKRWEQLLEYAKSELLEFAMQATKVTGEGGMHTQGYYIRVMELTLRIELLEELVTQINFKLNNQ